MVIINLFPCLRNCTLLPVFKVLLVLAFLGFLAWCLVFSGIFGRMFVITTPLINSTPTSISNCLGHLGLVSLRS